MKCKFILFALIAVFITIKQGSLSKRTINTGGFEIEVPANWKYERRKGIDSFVGIIKGDGISLSFDWSRWGLANHLIANETEFVYERKWEWMPVKLPYARKGVTYTSGSIEGTRKAIMKENGITDSSLVKVEKYQKPIEEIVLKENKYIAILTYKDTVVSIEIEIPKEIRNHLFEMDTLGQYKRKIIYPRKNKAGMTGIYIEDLNSDFNFNMVGFDLSIENQKKAIAAFKTIEIKN